MVHELWTSRDWENATDEQIISALFNAPQFLDPKDMGWLKRNKSHVIAQYQNLFYRSEIPDYAKRLK